MVGILLGIFLQADLREVSFTYDSRESLKTVAVAGQFNGWDKGKDLLKLDADGHTWRTRLKIAPGTYQYKLVLDGSRWITDPAAKSMDDGYGNVNSVLTVAPVGFENPARRGDGQVTAQALFHQQRGVFCYADSGSLHLRLRTRANDPDAVIAVTGEGSYDMHVTPRDQFYEEWDADIPWSKSRPLNYHFIVEDKTTHAAVTNAGRDFIAQPNLLQNNPPAWPERSVFYQIFPDRFANGDKSNDPAGLLPWNGNSSNKWAGGDAAGMLQKLPYLKGLGVNGIYLNPVTEANTAHRYDPISFTQVDHRFGTNAEYEKLIKTYREQGIRVIQDQVFDHIGLEYPPFKDLRENQQQSKFKDWFTVHSFPVTVKDPPPYEAWFGYSRMPKLRMTNPAVEKELLDSVTYWMKRTPLAGWRMDVAHEVPQEFWRHFRARLKELNPEAWSVGEIWTDASTWLNGDQWDASMNYPFRGVMTRYVAQGLGTAAEFLRDLNNVYRMYPPQVSRNELNLLDSHDTERWLTSCKGDKKKGLIGAAILLTFPGVPCIYYGDEIGMMGGADPDNRHGMEWDRVDPLDPYQASWRKLIALRKGSRVLQTGDFMPLGTTDHCVSFARRLGQQWTVVMMNLGDSPELVSPAVPRSVSSRLRVRYGTWSPKAQLAPRSIVVLSTEGQP